MQCTCKQSATINLQANLAYITDASLFEEKCARIFIRGFVCLSICPSIISEFIKTRKNCVKRLILFFYFLLLSSLTSFSSVFLCLCCPFLIGFCFSLSLFFFFFFFIFCFFFFFLLFLLLFFFLFSFFFSSYISYLEIKLYQLKLIKFNKMKSNKMKLNKNRHNKIK